ncbi:uncharacterized protein KY384_009236 [Bacidia gigantensis]|uniref:uncharacterized protein n=1 Tax=Bacidia gigantensis TaxID=2732470 RepID=UPI001D04C8EB|nr:uncharacterized protein KY384_009236 [Bacidia gigantensis]KAG8525592.1 hypothetical protein KY384_009236 [Bacidia gigantensis]
MAPPAKRIQRPISWFQYIPKFVSGLALKPNKDALIDVQKHCRCTDEVQDPASRPVRCMSLNMKQNVEDGKFAKPSGENGADIEYPFVQKANA